MCSLSLHEATKALGVSPRSLADRRYRTRIGLPARKVGRRVVFLEQDLRRLLAARRDGLPNATPEPAMAEAGLPKRGVRRRRSAAGRPSNTRDTFGGAGPRMTP